MIPGVNAFSRETLNNLSADEREQLHALIIDARAHTYGCNSERYAQYAQLEVLLLEVRQEKGDF